MKLYNTRTRENSEFKPLVAGKVGIYICGATVQSFPHIGHIRSGINFDILRRWLSASGYEVTFIRNVTDIDDKILEKAKTENMPWWALALKYEREFSTAYSELNVLPPTYEPRATGHITQMIELMQKLIDKGMAYAPGNGDVYLEVRKVKNYLSLSNQKLDDLQSADDADLKHKKDPRDFALWKGSKPGEPSWPTPWGPGRPGWHLECSAMAHAYLGESFDIHGGGLDLIFPHHENEIAQSEGAFAAETGKPFVNTWMHNGFVRVNEEKMSKSLGNFFTIREVLKEFDPEVVRFFILKAHYRSPLNYSDAHLEEAKQGLTRLYNALASVEDIPNYGKASTWRSRFVAVMNDDFNTPEAVAVLFELASEVNRAQGEEKQFLASTLKSLGATLNFLQRDPTTFLQSGSKEVDGLSPEEIEMQIANRQAAKLAKDFAKADSIRKTLLESGVVLEDKPGGITEWRRA